MTYQGNSASRGSQLMKLIIVVTIVLVAYWASNGGLDQIEVGEAVNTATVSDIE